ncbi:putative SNU66/SART1 family protein [Medicago truncatula]|uniref:Putative SNU66/SART1 family protein n=1 Tax=Medicago truncatula TaxID=3880 RepID=A0A396JTQ1_MEDTR|nr:SART-1 family protein DOT2 [Medicago truncatula]RHN78037.1 putative SNU66/SART1 family protein [Medicago truncatula]
MDMEWSESRYDDRNNKGESPVREHRKKSEKENRRRDRDHPKRASGDTKKDRGSRRERSRVEREKNRFNYGNSREKDYDREKHRDRDKKDRDSEKKRELEKDSDRVREKVKERERGKHRDREIRECNRDEHEKDRSMDRGKRKAREEDFELSNLDDKLNYHEKRDDDVGKHAKASILNQDDEDGETSAYLSSKEHSLKMKETRTTKQFEATSEISSWANKSRKFEKERVLQLSKIFEEQDNIAVEGSDDEDKTHHLAGLKVVHDLDKVAKVGTVVLTIRDQPIIVDGDIKEDADMLENVGIGEQKRRDDTYKAAKKKTSSIYDDKSNDVPSTEKKILPKYDDLAAEEGLTLNERGRFSSEAEKKLEELKRRLTGVSTNNFEDLTSSRKVSSDYYSNEEMLQFKKPKKKKSFRKKDKLDIIALEAEAVSSGLGVGDLGCRKDAKRQAIKDEQERLTTEMRNNAYRSAYAKADEASELLRPEQSMYVKIGEDETQVFADDEEDICKSLEKARRLTLKKHEEKGASGPQAIAILATSNPSNETIDDQTAARESRENKVVFSEMNEFVREMKEFVKGLHIDEDAREDEDVIMHDDEADVSAKETKDEAGEWTEVKETQKNEQLNSEDTEEIVSYETIREVALGKGMFGALKLCKDQGTLKENIEWGGRNTDKKKSKLVGVLEDEGREAQNKKEIHIERKDEFGRTLTPKEAYRILSQKFHGVEPGKMKQEKRKKKFHEELKLKQMQNSDTPLLFTERMREVQACTKTPYVVLSGRVKPRQTSDRKSGFATVEKDLAGDLTPMLG